MIVIRPPSLVRQWDAYVSIDPAFVQAPKPPADGEPTEDYQRELDEYLAKLKAARETGNWSALRVPGTAEPTKFVMGQVDRNAYRALVDRCHLPADSARRVGDVLLFPILMRLALKSVVGLGDVKIERSPDPNWDNWMMAQPEIVTLLDEINPSIVVELGMGVAARLAGLTPF